MIDKVATVVKARDFYRPAHQIIYEAILVQHTKGPAGSQADAKLVGERIQQDGDLRESGGFPYLHTLVNECLTPTNAVEYALLVSRAAVQRRIYAAGQRLKDLSWHGEDLPDTIQLVRSTVEDALDYQEARPPSWVAETITETVESLEKPADLWSTPWADVDRYLGGFSPGRLYIIGARPGVGKTVLCTQAAAHHAERHSQPTLMLTLEMSRREIDLRLLSALGHIPFDHLERRQLTDDDWTKLAVVQPRIASLKLSVLDRPVIRLEEIRRDALAMIVTQGLGMIVVDYLQLMAAEPGNRAPRHEVVSDYSRRLKLLAKELEVPIVAASQLNRAPAQRRDKRPSIHDLRESGSLEQDADAVILLHRDTEDPIGQHLITVHVAKNRHGPTGMAELDFQGEYQRVVQRTWTPHGVLGK
jgi:replicative DNA helicase